MPIIEGNGVTKYFGGLAAVANVDFHVDQGKIVGLIGPNGAGKTTLFNLISGAFVPNSGEIRFKGKNIVGLKPYKICRLGIGRTFQSIKVFPNMTVLENVLLGALLGIPKGTHIGDANAEAIELLQFVELSAKKESLAKELSFASQKRLEFARALATKPELLLLDEVIAGLTPAETAQFMELIKKMRNKGITVLMIEHIMKAIMSISDEIIVLHHGEKIAEGRPEEISTNKRVIEVYLGTGSYAKS